MPMGVYFVVDLNVLSSQGSPTRGSVVTGWFNNALFILYPVDLEQMSVVLCVSECG